jgi:Zn-dependent protease
MIGFILMTLAIVLSVVLMPLGFVYTLITFRFSIKRLGSYWKIIAISIDQLGNVVCANLFNDLLIKKEGHKFGDEDETISMVLGLNKASKTLLPLGKALAWLLNAIDPNHVEKAIED